MPLAFALQCPARNICPNPKENYGSYTPSDWAWVWIGVSFGMGASDSGLHDGTDGCLGSWRMLRNLRAKLNILEP